MIFMFKGSSSFLIYMDKNGVRGYSSMLCWDENYVANFVAFQKLNTYEKCQYEYDMTQLA